MVAGQVEKSVPLHYVTGGVNDVRDVCPVEALTTCDEKLRRDQLFGGQCLCRNSENFGERGTIDPRLVDTDNCVAHPGNQIHEIVPAAHFGQPDRIADLAMKTVLLEKLNRARHVLRGEEDIEILSVTPDAGMLVKRKGARDHIWDVASIQQFQHLAKQRLLLRREFWRSRGAYWQRFGLFRHRTLDVISFRCVAI